MICNFTSKRLWNWNAAKIYQMVFGTTFANSVCACPQRAFNSRNSLELLLVHTELSKEIGIFIYTDMIRWRGGKKEAGQEGDAWQWLTLIHVVVGHDGNALLPHHADVSPIAVTSPEKHRQQDWLGNGAPQHTQHHPVVGAVKLQTSKAHHLGRVSERLEKTQSAFILCGEVLDCLHIP